VTVARLAFTKADHPSPDTAKVRHRVTVARDDGSVTVVPMADYGPALPHDLAHFVVERELGLRHGFWGLVVAGTSFDTVGGRAGTPLATRTDPLVDTQRPELLLAEGLVNLLHRPDGRGLCTDAGDDHADRRWARSAADLVAASGAAGVAAPDAEAMARTRGALAVMTGRWSALGAGKSITEEWGD